MNKITFLGCGSWGGALGLALANKGMDVTMWHRNPEIVQKLSNTRKHYLVPSLIFPKSVTFTSSIDDAVLEAHRSYVDIQMLITGRELIEVMAKDKLTVTTPYHKENDVEFYKYSAEVDTVKLQLSPDRFAMFLPQDVHMPCLISAESPELVKKVVVKIRRDLLTSTPIQPL